MTPTLLTLLAVAASGSQDDLIGDHLERHARTFPTEATVAGRHDHDTALKDLGPGERRAWVATNRQVILELQERLGDPGLDSEDRLDAELVLRQASLQVFDFETSATARCGGFMRTCAKRAERTST